METINSITATAAKVIWGENDNTNNNATNESLTDTTTSTSPHEVNPTTATDSTTMSNETRGQEPISGKQGDVSKGEPYDAGNIEQPSTSTGTEPNTAGTTAVDNTTSNTANGTTTATGEEAVGSKGPTAEHPSTTGDTGFKAAQADVRDPDTNPTADPQKEEERKNVDDTGNLDESKNPDKVEGAGPKPIEEVARERGGDAGAGEAKAKDSSDPAAEGGDAAAADKNDDDNDGGESKGTGEQYVKSSGLQADGGDFDATNPGAGREADRLMEEKGIANPAAADSKKAEDNTPAESGHAEGEKKSLKDKIKAKLHKN